jgi:serine/threonine protein kinase
MEYLVGQSLDHVLRDPKFKPKTVEEILPILKQVADALSFAHANGFVHCDLKPGNIFITQSGRVKVIDFGIARAIKSGLVGAEDSTVFSTKELAALTPAFASPQMIELLDPEPNDDIYALACIVYELLSGQHPFRRVPANHARDSGMKPKRLSGLTNSQWQALVHALAFGSKERTPSATAFMEEFTRRERIGVGRLSGKFSKLGKLAALCTASTAIGFGVVLLTSNGLTPPVSSPQVQTPTSQPPVAQVPVVQPPAPQVPPAKPLPPTTQRSVQIEAPGAAEAAAAFGTWCGDSFKIMFGPAEGALTLPSATELRLKVERYQLVAGRLAVHTLATDGGRSIWEFGDFSTDGKSMIHLRQRNGDGNWRTYNRRLRRC